MKINSGHRRSYKNKLTNQESGQTTRESWPNSLPRTTEKKKLKDMVS